MLKSQRKAAEDAEKANQISLEEFLEVEVRLSRPPNTFCRLTTSKASQTWQQSHAGHAGVVRKVEADADGQKTCRGRRHEEGQGCAGRRWQELWHEWQRFGTFLGLCWSIAAAYVVYPQFTYNPEWFDDSDEEEDEWDLATYRKEKEDEDLALEEERIRNLSLQDGGAPSATGD